MTKANRGFTLMHNRSKFHEKRGFRLEQIRLKQAKGFGKASGFRHDIGFRLEQIRLKQAKGFGKAPSFRHDIGFRMRQMLYFRLFKPPSRANRGSCRTTNIRWASMACGCCNICEKKRGFRLHTALFRATEPPPTTPSEPPRHARPIGR